MKTAKLFRNGRSQAVRLPKEFRFRGTQVFVKKIGNTVLLIPVQDSWQTLFDSLSQFSEDFLANFAREKVKYAEIIKSFIDKTYPDLIMSKLGPEDLARPKP